MVVQQDINPLQKKGTTIPELAEEYGVSESLLYKMANANTLPGCRRMGYRFVVSPTEFDEWLRSGGKE